LPYLSAENYAVALNRVQTLPHGEQRLAFTEALLPYLTQEQCIEIVATLPLFQPDIVLATDPELATLADWNKRWQMQTLALLAPYLPRDRFLPSAPIALKRLRELSEDVQTWILQRMTQYLPEDLLTETFEIIWSMADSSYRTQALQALVSYLSADGWLKVLELVQAKMHTTRNPQITVEFLSVAKDKVKQSTPAQLYPILHETLHLMVQQTRRDTLVALTSLLPTIHIVGGKQAVQQTCNATLEIGCWWP
jgi:hypothetical protein